MMDRIDPPLSSKLRALLRLTRHADEPAALCRHCLHQQIREELASISRAQDLERCATEKSLKELRPC